MSLHQIAAVRGFLEQNKLDAAEVLAVLLRTMLADLRSMPKRSL